MQDVKLQLQYCWILESFEELRHVDWQIFTNISKRRGDSSFRGKESVPSKRR